MYKLLLFLIAVQRTVADPVPLLEQVDNQQEFSSKDVNVQNGLNVTKNLAMAEKTPRTAAAAASAAAASAAIITLANITFSSAIVSGPNSCPPAHLFSPCDCFVHEENARIIRCTGEHNIDLNSIFQRLSIYLIKPEKHFHMFYLNNTNISYLGNVFHDITFEYICKYFFSYFNQTEKLKAEKHLLC